MRYAHLAPLAAGIFGLFVLANCSSAPPAPKPVAECEFPDSPGAAAPTWVCTNIYAGYKYTGVGNGKSQSTSVAITLADAEARKQLAVQMGQRVQAMLKTFTQSTGTGNQETIDRVSTDVARFLTDQTLVGVKRLNMRTSPGGTLYIIVGMETDDGIKATQQALRTSYGNRKADYQRLLGEQGDKELEEKLDKLTEQNAQQ